MFNWFTCLNVYTFAEQLEKGSTKRNPPSQNKTSSFNLCRDKGISNCNKRQLADL